MAGQTLELSDVKRPIWCDSCARVQKSSPPLSGEAPDGQEIPSALYAAVVALTAGRCTVKGTWTASLGGWDECGN